MEIRDLLPLGLLMFLTLWLFHVGDLLVKKRRQIKALKKEIVELKKALAKYE